MLGGHDSWPLKQLKFASSLIERLCFMNIASTLSWASLLGNGSSLFDISSATRTAGSVLKASYLVFAVTFTKSVIEREGNLF